MEVFLFFIFVVSVSSYNFNSDWDDHWKSFKNKHNRNYKDDKEEAERRKIWEDRLYRINEHNKQYNNGVHLFHRGLNEFSDMKHENFVLKNGYKTRNARNYTKPEFAFEWEDPFANDPSDTTANSTVDWRKFGVIDPVKNQGQCGSCWSFASTGLLSAYYSIKTGKLISLSEQNLMDCSKSEGNDGCDGGSTDDAFAYIIKNKGLNSEEDYPYLEKSENCRYNPKKVAANCTGYVNIPKGDEDALVKAISYYGPAAVAIDASHESFQDYQGGIYNEPKCDSDKIDHAVLVIGYGTEDGHDYWLIKNSWGTTWGIDGYMKMIRNKNNTCGIATEANYPKI